MKATLFRLYLTEEGLWVRFWRLLRLASTAVVLTTTALSIAKGAAYSSLLSFFPLITTLAALLVQARADEVARTISSFLYEVVPPGTEDVVRTLFVVHGQRPAYLLVFAVMLAVWAASGAMMSLMEGFDGIYHVPSSRNFIRERGMAILLVFVSFVPVLGASGLIVSGTRAERLLTSWLGLTHAGPGHWRLGDPGWTDVALWNRLRLVCTGDRSDLLLGAEPEAIVPNRSFRERFWPLSYG